jgi:hypothetical protein
MVIIIPYLIYKFLFYFVDLFLLSTRSLLKSMNVSEVWGIRASEIEKMSL